MKLLSLSLENFKGIKKLDLKPDGKDLNIYGRNATGKTTIADAFTWLLFDKDSENKSVFNIKPLAEDGEVKNHAAETIVRGIFDVDSEIIELEKRYKEKWTKRHGNTEAEFDGHTTDYFINEVPRRKRDYDDYVNEICNTDLFRMLTDVFYFCETMDWKDRRNILFEILGNEVTDENILASDDLKPLEEALGKHSIDDFKAIQTAKRKRINDELEDIPIRISERINSNEMDIDIKLENKKIEELKKKLEPFETKKQEIINGLGSLSIKNKISEHKNKLNELDIENKSYKQEQEKLKYEDTLKIKNETNEKITSVKDKISIYKRKLVTAEEAVTKNEKEIEQLREEWNKLNGLEWDRDNEICPTCKQKLPESEIEEAMERFNENKALKLEINKDNGMLKAENIKLSKKEIETINENISKLEHSLKDLEISLNDIKEKEEKVEITDLKDYEVNKEKISKEIEKLEKDLDKGILSQKDLVEDINKDILEIKEKISEHERNIIIHEQQETNRKRIKELEEQRAVLVKELDNVQLLLNLIDEFTITKISLVEEKVNGMFEHASFKLFEKQINGGIKEVCKATYKGIPFDEDLNNGQKLNIGLDVINTLSKYYKFAAPIFIDNAESVTDWIDSNSQIIRLIVSKEDDELRVE